MSNRTVWIALVAMAAMVSPAFAQREVPGFSNPYSMRGSLALKRIEAAKGLGQGAIVLQRAESLPADAKALMGVFDGEAAAIRQRAEQEIQAKQQTLIAALQALQDAYTRDAKLDEAVAIRNTIRQMKVSHLKVQPGPANLSEYVNHVGESFHFDVLGQTGYTIWGSEVYTCDSNLATAAVHAGVLNEGQRGIVKVTILKSPESHQGSVAHGVTSSSWGSYSSSYTVEHPNLDAIPALKTKPATP